MQPIEVVFSFDTTGSMYPCLTQVRRKVKETVARLAKELPDIRIGVIVHGDYCDEGSSYLLKKLDLSDDTKRIAKFVTDVAASGGGDSPEAYEYALHEARALDWTSKATRALVMIGDEVPHPASYNKRKLDWRKEAKALAKEGVLIFGVQALNRGHATKFYTELSKLGGGAYLTLDQFAYITDLILAICYKQASDKLVAKYEEEVVEEGRMSRGLHRIFNALLERKASKDYDVEDLHACEPGRFQVLDVDDDCVIREFVMDNGLNFRPGRGFYEFTKTETIQPYKEIILMENGTGDLFEGDKARELLELPDDETINLKPTDLDKYVVFVQSTSYNRKLIGGTRFLYEVEDWGDGDEPEWKKKKKALAAKKPKSKKKVKKKAKAKSR